MNINRAPIPLRDAIIGYALAWLAGNLLAGFVLLASGEQTVIEAGPGWVVPISLAQWLPYLVLLWFLGRQFGAGRPSVDYGVSFRPIDLIGIPIGVATQLVLLPLLYWPLQSIWHDAFTDDKIEKRARELWDSASGGSGVVLLVLVVVVGAPVVEELVYRGLLQGAVGRSLRQWRGWLAVVVVAAVFALVHFSPVEYPGLFLVGLILGACALRTGRLGMGMLAHFAFNVCGLVWVASS